MTSPQKQITISIVKAFSQSQNDTQQQLQLSFYSLISKSLILQKNITPSVSNRQLNINSSLKITYTNEQSQILLKMSRIDDKGSLEFMSEFLIDLDLLAERKVQFLPFNKNDKILEVVSGLKICEQPNKQKSVPNVDKIDNFIQEKSQFLKNISSQNDSVYGIDERTSNSKNFTQKLYALLQETRKIRQKIERQKKSSMQDYQDFNNDDMIKNSEKLSVNGEEVSNQKLLTKSSSQNLLTVPKNFTKNNTKNERTNMPRKKWVFGPHFKLDLKSLAIVDSNRMVQDTIKQDQDEVLRSKQEAFSQFKGHRHQSSAYLPNINQNS